MVASLENKVLDIRKENDNLKTHLLASNSISHSNIGNIQPQMGSSQMEMNLTVRLQAIENELLRMRLNMQDTAGNTGMKCNPCERNNFSEDKINFLESRISILESENRHLGNRLSATELKLKINENELRLRQAVVTPSYFHTGYNLQYMPAPTNKQTVINTKTESAKVNSKFQKGYVTKQNVPGRSPTSTKVKSVSDSYQDKSNGENGCNGSVICMEDSGEIQKEIEQNLTPYQKEKCNKQNIAEDKGKNEKRIETIDNVHRKDELTDEPDVSLKNTEHNQSFLSITQPQLQPPWYQKKNSQN